MLDLTPKEVSQRTGLKINPAKTCQPVGAMYAALGIHGCMPHSHGSQGCCSFHRMFLTRHFKDPAMAASSSFTEGASVFGGGSNLRTAIKNIFEIYDPEIIAVHTTCLTETIGDDLVSIVASAQIPEGKFVIHCNTPSYVGSHITGFANMVKGMVNGLSNNSGFINDKINVIPGFTNPGDMREMKRIMELMDQEYIMFPDTSGVLDAPMTGKFEMYPKGGTKIDDIVDAGNSVLTLALGSFASEAGAIALEKKCGVPFKTLDLPIGIEATDRFVMALAKAGNNAVPYSLEEERGQLVDIMIDAHPYYHGKKVAIFGDSDTVIGLAEFAISLGMIPKYVVTGTPGESFNTRMKDMFEAAGLEDCVAKSSGDLFELHQWIKNDPVDLLMGGTHGKYIARAEDVPFVRVGFPIVDRFVHSYMPIVGYKGAIRLVEMIANTLMDRQDRDCADEDVEMIM